MPFADPAKARQWDRDKRWGHPAAPTPPGYIALSEAAQRLHYTRSGLYRQILSGKWDGAAYQRPDGGRWFLQEEAVNARATHAR